MQSIVSNTSPHTEFDDETIEFANADFDLSRAGDAETLGALLGNGLSRIDGTIDATETARAIAAGPRNKPPRRRFRGPLGHSV